MTFYDGKAGAEPDCAADAPEVRSETPWIRRWPLLAPTLPPATHTNSYLFGQRELLLLDPGSPLDSENERLLEAVCELQEAGCSISAIVLTHHHPDHVVGTTYWQKQLAAPVWAHAFTVPQLSEIGIHVDRTLVDGETLPFGPQGCTILHTPGHARGHLCLLDGAGGGLVAGDMVASIGTVRINPSDGGDMAVYMAQLTRLLHLALQTQPGDPLRLWPAHGASMAKGEERLRFYLWHRQMREDKVVAALQKGSASIKKLMPLVYADRPDADPILAEGSLLAHLYKLASEGRAIADAQGIWSLIAGG